MRGAAALRRKLKNLDPAVRTELLAAMEQGARQLLPIMRSQAPSSRVKAALSVKVYPKSLRVRVGLIGKAVNRRLFFAGILEFGRGIKRTRDRIGRKIGIIRAARYIYGPRTDIRRAVGGRVRDVFARALARAGAGGGSG